MSYLSKLGVAWEAATALLLLNYEEESLLILDKTSCNPVILYALELLGASSFN